MYQYRVQSELVEAGDYTVNGPVVTLPDGTAITLMPHPENPSVVVATDGQRTVPVSIRRVEGTAVEISLLGYVFELNALSDRDQYFQQLLRSTARPNSGKAKVVAPMPGLIKSVLVEDGQTVKKGDRLCVLEAMKMENDIKAPQDGVVRDVRAKAGLAVEKNFLLCILEPAEA